VITHLQLIKLIIIIITIIIDLPECAIFSVQNIHQGPAPNGHWHVHDDVFQRAVPENIEEQ
jgi:hypothetical protein